MMRAPSVVLVGMVLGCGTREPAIVDADEVAPVTVDATSCTALQVTAPGRIMAPTLPAAPVIDGRLDDWTTCFLALNRVNAGFRRSFTSARAFPVAQFSVARYGTSIYVAAVVTGVTPLGDNTTDVRDNDNIEVYIDGDGLTMIGYGTDAREIVIDHGDRLQGFRTGRPVDIGTMQHAVVESGGRYTVELQLDPQTFGLDAFGSTIGFDFGISDGDGQRLATELVWTKQCESTVTCDCWYLGDDAPYCDSRQFGRVVFAP